MLKKENKEKLGQFSGKSSFESVENFKLRMNLTDRDYFITLKKMYSKELRELTIIDNGIYMDIYIHIPFCETKCTFCPYESIRIKNELEVERYVAALIHEIKLVFSNVLSDKINVNSLCFGGGTPSILSIEHLKKIIMALKQQTNLNFPKDIEFNMEFTTNHVNLEKRLLPIYDFIRQALPLNKFRISCGVQSFDNKVLSVTNRGHDKNQAIAAIEHLDKFKTISNSITYNVDLMVGLPNQTEKSTRHDINYLIKKGVPHITLEHTRVLPETPLFKMKGKYSFLSQNEIKRILRKNYSLLKSNGYVAIPAGSFIQWVMHGHETAYKLDCRRTLAFGKGAITDMLNFRYRNYRNDEIYLEALKNNNLPHGEIRVYNIEDRIVSYILHEFRRNRCFSIKDVEIKHGVDSTTFLNKTIIDLQQQKLINIYANKVMLSDKISWLDALACLKKGKDKQRLKEYEDSMNKQTLTERKTSRLD
jgi:oxygen-independent coproporphyrinogen-3 oxidase